MEGFRELLGTIRRLRTMKKLRKLFLACFLTCSSFITAPAQTSTTLKTGTSIERDLGPGQSHVFTVEAEANSFVRLVVDQKGIDVIITVTAPDGQIVRQFDTPNGANGPENVGFMALAAGAYSLTVGPLDSLNASKGRYEIKLLELRKATEEERTASHNRDVAKKKALDLLRELEGFITQMKSPTTRVRSRVKAADLLWDEDEKRAAKYLTDATTDLKEMIASVDVNDSDYQRTYAQVWQLRFEMVQLLAEVDPEKALSFLYATVPPANPYNEHEQASQETGLELTIASRMMNDNPQRSFEIARRSLKQGYSAQLASTLEELKQREPKLATELANEILAKLSAEKLIDNNDAAQLAVALLGSIGMRTDGGKVAFMERQAPVITEAKHKELMQKLLNEALSIKPSSNPHGRYQSPGQWTVLQALKVMGADLDKIAPGSSAEVDKKFSELTGAVTPFIAPEAPTGPVEDALVNIEQAPVETRDQLYYMLAMREAGSGAAKRARDIINDHVKSPHMRREWLKQLEQQEIAKAVTSGKVEDAIRIISTLRTPKERAVYLHQLIGNIQNEQKPETAIALLEQVRALLPPSPVAQDEEQMIGLLEIARGFSRHDSKRGFEIIEPLIDQFNEICAAARTLQGFGGVYYFVDDELAEDESSLAATANQLTSVLGALGLNNFERAKSIADRFSLPEMRLRAYLTLAEQALQGDK